MSCAARQMSISDITSTKLHSRRRSRFKIKDPDRKRRWEAIVAHAEKWWVLGTLAVLLALARPAAADLAVTANDSHTTNIDGVAGPAKDPRPDTVSIIDVSQYPPKLVETVHAPTIVFGAPTSIWISPDESFVIVIAATKIEPQNPDRIVPDDRVSVISLKISYREKQAYVAAPAQVVQQVTAGEG